MRQFIKFFIKRGSIIGSSKDTGYYLYRLYCDKVKHECIKPVFGGKLPEIRPGYLKSSWNKILEKFLPESFCYIPKRGDYYSKEDFEQMGFLGVIDRGWDEFVWKGEPFGFHMQGAKKDGTTTDHTSSLPFLKKVLSYYNQK